MRGGALEIKGIKGQPIEMTESDFNRMDNIQVVLLSFIKPNLYEMSRIVRDIEWNLDDTGDPDPEDFDRMINWANRARRNNLLSTALGRVPIDGYEVRWVNQGEYNEFSEGMYGAADGRAGVQNRHMADLVQELDEQLKACKDIYEYEGHPLPSRLPLVLREGEWAQIEEDWMDYAE